MINIEYKNGNKFPIFFEKIKNKKIAVMYDINTKPYADNIIFYLNKIVDIERIEFLDSALIPNEKAISFADKTVKGKDYLLAVGSGTLNDLGKIISFNNKIPCGILATAPSMDGYCSVGSAIMQNGKKVTLSAHSPEDVLIDLDIITSAPSLMIASGFGDIVGKDTCLTDWKLSNIINGEEINYEAYNLMEKALNDCVANYKGLLKRKPEAVAKLMEALISAGLSMAKCGNSRPASGSEHHMSHYLEMDFISKNKIVPLHGIKVGIGALISIELYQYIREHKVDFEHSNEVYSLAEKLPKAKNIAKMLKGLSCPIKFSEIGVERKVMENMLKEAYLVRDRYTILTLYNELGLTNQVLSKIMKKYY